MKLTELQKHQGSPLITSFCDRCDCRVITSHDGRCVWCDKPLPRFFLKAA